LLFFIHYSPHAIAELAVRLTGLGFSDIDTGQVLPAQRKRLTDIKDIGCNSWHKWRVNGGDDMATVEQKVVFLSDPRSYPHNPEAVEPIETHMSWVFLAGDRVFKFKKPVAFPFLDFTTLEMRKDNCAEEFRLNQTLAEDTYQRVLPLTEASSGALALDGDGAVVEWLVEMKRLHRADSLDARLAAGGVEPDDIAAVAEKLALFYKNSAPQVADGVLYLKHLAHEHAVNRKILTRPEFELTDHAIQAIEEVDARLEVVREEIEARIAAGLIVEGHGDLRPEHVYLGTPPLIIDRLEFDRSMRILDPYDEANYLGLECQFVGNSWIRSLLLETLDKHLDARPSPALMGFYSAFRAVLRARICIAHLLDDEPATPEKWPKRARDYLSLAHVECASSPPQADGGSSHRRADA
jgi:aminoglycoside phosphotransferase family enzyme